MNKSKINNGINVTTIPPKKDVKIPKKHVNFDTEGIVKIMPTLKEQIDYLHNVIRNKEWSGILFYKVVKGGLSNVNKMVIEAHYVMPLNIGSATYTEYDPDAAALDAFDMFEGSEEMERGTIHTHHNMSAFFSGTDTEDLLEKIADGSHSSYLSLIVNYQEEYVVKVAMLSENSFVQYNMKSGKKNFNVVVKSEEAAALSYSLKVQLPPGKEMPKPFRKQVEKVVEAARSTATNHSQTHTAYQRAGTHIGTGNAQTGRTVSRTHNVEENAGEKEKGKALEKEDMVENDPEGLFNMIDLITVGHQYGNVFEMTNCESFIDIFKIVYDGVELIHGEGDEAMKTFADEVREYMVRRLQGDSERSTTSIILAQEAADLAGVINSIDLTGMDIIPADRDLSSFINFMEITFRNVKLNAYKVLSRYPEAVKVD